MQIAFIYGENFIYISLSIRFNIYTYFALFDNTNPDIILDNKVNC